MFTLHMWQVMAVYATSLTNGTLSSNLTGSQKGDNIPSPLYTAEHLCSVMGAVIYQGQVVLGGSG